MESVAWALIFKPLIGAAVVVLLVVLPILFCRYVLKPIFPEGRIKEYLFRESVTDGEAKSAAGSADSNKRLLD